MEVITELQHSFKVDYVWYFNSYDASGYKRSMEKSCLF